MSRRREPYLHEAILLLGLHHKKGTLEAGSMHTYALAGGLLAELLIAGKLGVEGEGKKAKVVVRDPSPTGDELLDEALERIRTAKKQATARTWVPRLAGIEDLRTRTAHRLCERGILRARKEKVLLLFHREVYPTLDLGPEREVIGRIREAVTGDGEVPPRTSVLVALAKSVGLLDPVLSKEEQEARKERIEALSSGELVGEAAREAVEAARAALVVTTAVMPAMMAISVNT